MRWALRTIHHRSRRKAHIVRYDAHTDQFSALRLADRTDGPQPATVVLHGGFWRSRWQFDLMDALPVAIAERDVASRNVEYRRPDR